MSMHFQFQSFVREFKFLNTNLFNVFILRRFMKLAFYFTIVFASLLIFPELRAIVYKERNNNHIYHCDAVYSLVKHKHHYLLKSYVPAVRSYTGNQSVTLTTQATTSYLNHVPMLCKRWDGPMSIAVYVGDGKQEFVKAFEIINYLRQCTHRCVLQNVTWHFVAELNAEIPSPNTNKVFLPLEYWTPPRWVDPVNYDCNVAGIMKHFEEKDFKRFEKAGLPYPINVARNLAREAATTFYVFPSDIELYPSADIIPRFLRLVSSERRNRISESHVYTLPVFEVEHDVEPPEDKETMVKVLKNNRGIFFRKHLCDPCFKFPGRDTWLDTIQSRDSLGIHAWDKRIHPNWEPFYICTKSEPEYLEDLSWEGRLDKMTQTFHMCVLNYTFSVLDNAFLVHSPGIKENTEHDAEYLETRRPYELRNFFAHERRIRELKFKYKLGNETIKSCGDPALTRQRFGI